MRNNILSLNNIGIKFELNGKPRESLSKIYRRLFSPKKEFWALRNISFEIPEGEILFIVGRNGAGKSTLLKVLAETLFPDEGTMTTLICNKSFVSMGLGFRNELSGYENMDIALKLMGVEPDNLKEYKQDIIHFTQLGDFIYEPVENYSAGMRARLAFAVATSNAPDVLIMDEVINAGDQQFREKCKVRMQSMLTSSKAVIVCTHNLGNAEAIGTRALWLENGEIVGIDDPKTIIKEYRQFINKINVGNDNDRK